MFEAKQATKRAAPTPGPWDLTIHGPHVDGDLSFTVEAPNGSCSGGNIVLDDVCIEGRTQEEQIATARLIAAAPEMLDALKHIAFHYDGDPEDLPQVRDAIRLATTGKRAS